jgi:hypothetical protein
MAVTWPGARGDYPSVSRPDLADPRCGAGKELKARHYTQIRTRRNRPVSRAIPLDRRIDETSVARVQERVGHKGKQHHGTADQRRAARLLAEKEPDPDRRQNHFQ